MRVASFLLGSVTKRVLNCYSYATYGSQSGFERWRAVRENISAKKRHSPGAFRMESHKKFHILLLMVREKARGRKVIRRCFWFSQRNGFLFLLQYICMCTPKNFSISLQRVRAVRHTKACCCFVEALNFFSENCNLCPQYLRDQFCARPKKAGAVDALKG